MQQKRFLHSWVMVALFLTASQKECTAKEEKPEEKDPIAIVQNRYNELFMNEKRYRPPSYLSNENEKFRHLSDRQKEKKLLKWFNEKVHKKLEKLAFQDITRKVGLMLLAVPIFLVLFGGSYLAITKIFWNFMRSLIRVISSEKGAMQELEKLLDDLWKALPRLNILNTIFAKENNSNGSPLPEEGKSKLVKINNLVKLLALYYTLSYFKMPLSWVWKHVYDTWRLYKFMRNPYLDSKVVKADHAYIKSYYLFDDQQKGIIESLLVSAHKGDFPRVRELENYVLTFRSLPKGVKPVVYDQKAIDIAFEGYTPELKNLAENVIALLVVYTEAIQADKGNLLQGLPIKPILLSGLPGTGKSRFIKKISEVTGLNITYVSLASEFRVEFKGQNGDKKLLGLPSSYVRAFKASADEWGRNYENNIVVFEEISSNFHDKMAVDYLKIFLDPRVRKVKDTYMRVAIPKLPFIFATSNEIPQEPALYDRFMIFKLDNIEKNNKKMIMGKQAHLWSAFLAHPELQDGYDESFDGQEVTAYLTKKANYFIDTQDRKGSIRASEEQTLKEIMSLIKKKVKKSSEQEKDSHEVVEAA